jgi:hypothetical protein
MAEFPAVDLVADYKSPGLVVYWFEVNEKGAILVAEGAAIVLSNRRLLRPDNWTPGQSAPRPSYVISLSVEEACGWALVSVTGALYFVNIVENIGTVGLGTIDDIIVYPTGVLMLDLARQLGVSVQIIEP